jgi:serine/threonine protein kinase
MSGELIGHRYRVLRKIGEGGMAVIHVAVDEKLGRDVAIKILKERYENHDEIRVRFQHEARAISAFDHPNILKIFDFSGEDSKQLWIVTELIHGRNLAQILETTPNGWLHPVIAASIVREICRALQTAHEHGVVHRDVKPENVMITHHGGVKLMDFGIAKIQRITSMTQTGMFMGSPSYMSPEQIRGRDVDHRSDVYSLGVLFYELVTGKLPYTGSSTADIAMKIIGGGFAHPRFVMAGIPQDIDQCIVKCMELLPENRPQSIDEVGVILDQLLSAMGLESSLQELERCFKDPKAYGDRLAKILRVTEYKAAPTVLINPDTSHPKTAITSESPSKNSVKKWNQEAISSPIPRPDISGSNLPQGSTRRDHLLPPRTVPQLTKRHHNPDFIAAHLPERRHQQRLTQVPQQHHVKSSAKVPQRPMSQMQYQQQIPPQKRRDMKPVSRIVPAAPKKAPKVRYVIRDDYDYRQSSNGFGKFVAAVLLLVAAGILWFGTSRNANIHFKNFSNQIVKNKKEKTTANDLKKNTTNRVDSKKSDILTSTKPVVDASQTPPAIAITPQKDIKESNSPASNSLVSGDERPKNTSKDKKLAASKAERPKNQKASPEIKQANTNSNAVGKTAPINTAPVNPSSMVAIPPVSLKPYPATIEEKPDDSGSQGSLRTAIDVSQQKPAIAQPQIAAKAQLAVSSMPAAELYIDGRRHGTTNDLGTSSNWIEVASGNRKIELKRSGYTVKTEIINITAGARQKFGPYQMQRGDSQQSKSGAYRLTLATNLTPADVTIKNIETRATQSLTLSQNQQTVSLDRGIYEVIMRHNGDTRRRRIDLSGAAQQLTFSVEFKESKTNTNTKEE